MTFWVAALTVTMAFALRGEAAPRAEFVMDMRTGEVIHADNADTQLHPASLTKMMTLYIAFEAIEHGEIALDTMVTISQHAASEPPSKLGLKPGQKIQLRYLIRAAAIKSANDAATAIGEAISGSEAAFARRMNRTAEALGMTRSHFKNAHGLTEAGHLSTARDMTNLGRHLFFDYPDYYHLFKRRSIDIPGKTLPSTNRRFLSAYQGADGIKTGFTNAAGFNLVASAERGSRRVIATMFGGTSTQARNDRVAQLLDLGFAKTPERVAFVPPPHPGYVGPNGSNSGTVRVAGAPERSIRPRPKPGLAAPSEAVVVAIAGRRSPDASQICCRWCRSSRQDPCPLAVRDGRRQSCRHHRPQRCGTSASCGSFGTAHLCQPSTGSGSSRRSHHCLTDRPACEHRTRLSERWQTSLG